MPFVAEPPAPAVGVGMSGRADGWIGWALVGGNAPVRRVGLGLLVGMEE